MVAACASSTMCASPRSRNTAVESKNKNIKSQIQCRQYIIVVACIIPQ